jgi:hypothetical protein
MAKPVEPRTRSFGRRLFLSLLPIVPLYLLSEVILSAIDYPHFVGVPRSGPFSAAFQKPSPWGDLRWVSEREYLEIRTTYELPYQVRAFLPPKTPPADAKRLVFIGDSVLFGAGVEENETMPFFLMAYLNYYRARPVSDAVDLGVPGADTLTYLRMSPVALLYKPALIVLSFTVGNDGEINPFLLDDVLPPREAVERPLSEPVFVPQTKGIVRRKPRPFRTVRMIRYFRDELLTHSRTLSALYMMIRPTECRVRQNLYLEKTLGRPERWAAVRGNLVETLDFFRKRKIPVIVLIYPYMFATHGIGLNDIDRYPYGKYHMMVRKLMEQQKVPVIDLLDYFRAEGVRSLDPYSIDGDGHPNGAFNALVARRLARDLMGRLGVFGQSREAKAPSKAGMPR